MMHAARVFGGSDDDVVSQKIFGCVFAQQLLVFGVGLWLLDWTQSQECIQYAIILPD